MKLMTWREAAWRAVAEVEAACPPGITRAQYCRALRDAYPFGPRQYWPYRVWLEVQRVAIERRFPGTTRPRRPGKPKKDRNPGQLRLFGA